MYPQHYFRKLSQTGYFKIAFVYLFQLLDLKKTEMHMKPAALREYVFTNPSLLSCGADYVALIKHGHLYTWGCAADGR